MFNERNFIPRLGQGDFPDIIHYASPNDADFRKAADLWNARMPEQYQDLLFATVVGDRDHLFSIDERGDWRWLQRSFRYRNPKTREVISDAKWVDLRDDFTDALYPDMNSISEGLVSRDITVHEWLRRMARLIQQAHLGAWLFGSGGYNTIDSSSIVTLGQTLREQYDYLYSFADEIVRQNRVSRQDEIFDIPLSIPLIQLPTPRPRPQPLPADESRPRGPITERGLYNRSIMYIESMTQSAERARVTTYEFHPDILPAYPGDGSTICLARCRCHWQFIFPRSAQGSYYHAYWRLRGHHPDGRNCATCLQYTRQWNPYTVERF